MSDIIVTGAAGFIGSHLCERLLRDGHRVLGIDNFDPFYDEAIKRRNLAGSFGFPEFHLAEGDLGRDAFAEPVRRAIGRADAIIHLAAKAGVRPSIAEPEAYVRANVAGTGAALELARDLGIKRFIFGSSSSVYGNDTPVPFDETAAAMTPISPYAATKRAGEILCDTWARVFGMQIIALRFFTVVGERQRPDLALHGFTKAIAEGKTIKLYGNGDLRRDYTYVGDIVDGVVAALKYAERVPPGTQEIINLGGHATTSVSELVAMIERELGIKAKVELHPVPQGDVNITYANVAKAKALLGYAPTVPVAEAVAKFVRWYREVHAATNSNASPGAE